MERFINRTGIGAVVMAICLLFSCFNNTSNETGSMNTPKGNGSLVVNTSYNGTIKSDGTGKIYVYLYSSLGTAQDLPVYQASTDAETTVGAENTITIDGIAAGNYYVLVFYDFKHHNNNIAGNSDRYVLYNNTPYALDAAAVAISDGNTTTLSDIAFGDTHQFGSSGAFVPKTATGSLSLTATYTGVTGGIGSGKIYAYLYSSLGTAMTAPLYQGNTSTISSGVITIANVPVGDYYLALLYDYADNGATPAGENDPYCLYGTTQYREDAVKVTITDGGTTSVSQTFADTWTLAAGGAFMVKPIPPGSVEVKATYNGTAKTDGTGKIFVYLYDALSTAATAPLYQADTGGAATIGTEYTITVSNVPAGNYYVLIFYDYKQQSSYAAGNTDRYELYDNTGSMAGASTVTVTSGSTTTLSGIAFDDTWKLGSGGAYNP